MTRMCIIFSRKTGRNLSDNPEFINGYIQIQELPERFDLNADSFVALVIDELPFQPSQRAPDDLDRRTGWQVCVAPVFRQEKVIRFFKIKPDRFDLFFRDSYSFAFKRNIPYNTIGIEHIEILVLRDMNENVRAEQRLLDPFFPVGPLSQGTLQRKIAFYSPADQIGISLLFCSWQCIYRVPVQSSKCKVQS